MPPRRELPEVDETSGKWDKGKWVRDDPERPLKKQKFLSQAELLKELPLPVASIPGTARDALPMFRKGSRRPPSVWLKDGNLFVGYNTPEVAIPPHTANARSARQLSTLEWEQLELPYLPFIPLSFNFSGRLLRRLNVDASNVPVSYDRSIVTMEVSLVNAWVRLESNLLRIVNILKAKSGYKEVKFPPLPRSHRLYAKYVWTKKDDVVRDALATRDRFIPLVALVAFYCSLRMNLQEYRLSGTSTRQTGRWTQYQADCIAGGVHPQWLILMNDSPAFCGFRCRRRGVIIDYRASEFTTLTPFFIDCGVPVVLQFNPRTMHENIDTKLIPRFLSMFRTLGFAFHSVESINAALREYLPPANVVDRVREQLAIKDVSDKFSFSLDDAYNHNSMENVSSECLSKEKPKETRVEFFARRDNERVEYLKTESAVQKQRRESRELAARSFNVPGERSKVKVFVWNWDGSYEVRTLAERGDYEFLWTEVRKSEMRFDGVRNEWDLWYKNLPVKGFRPPTEDESEEQDWLELNDDAPQDTERLCPPEFHKDSFRDEALEIFGHKLNRADGHYIDAVKFRNLYPLIKRLQVFYGFNHYSYDESTVISDRLNRERIRHILQDSITPLEDERLEKRLRHFILYLIRGKPPSSPLHDLHNSRIYNFGNPLVMVQHSSYRAREFEDVKSPYYALFSIVLLDSNGVPREDRLKRLFFVWSATIALAVKRFLPEETRSFDSIAHILLEIGVPFVLALPRVSFRMPLDDQRVTGLGIWTKETKHNDALDFLAYMRKCRELMSVRRLRKCLRYGGILWRLACLFLDYTDGLDGPTPDALNEPQALIGPEDLIEDGVSKEEIELLIGTFYIVPELGTKESPVQYSYWPPPYVWSSQGDCVGPWSPDNEDWFLNRIRLYHEGGTALYSIGEWRHKVSGFKESKDMMKNLEALSKQFIL